MKRSKIAVLTGGGDCAGLNPAIKWVVKSAMNERFPNDSGVTYEVVGVPDGWAGLLDLDPLVGNNGRVLVPLDSNVVRIWDRYGGTNLGTSRTNPYTPKNDRSKILLKNIEKLELEVVVAIGGEDTLGVACKLAQAGVNVVGIPKTIDKDLKETDYTLGFETALNVITEEVDRLRTTAGSHKRIFVVETMGRKAGWLALRGGESCGAYIILIPEYDFSMDKVSRLVVEGILSGSRYEIIVVAEGAKPEGRSEFTREAGVDSFGHKMLGGVGEFVADGLSKAIGQTVRSIALSYLQRGGAPCAYDRRMGRYFGIAAVDLIAHRKFGRMVSYRNGEMTSVPLADVVGGLNLVDTRKQYDCDSYNGMRTILVNQGCRI